MPVFVLAAHQIEHEGLVKIERPFIEPVCGNSAACSGKLLILLLDACKTRHSFVTALVVGECLSEMGCD
jgi:hypothetical protein